MTTLAPTADRSQHLIQPVHGAERQERRIPVGWLEKPVDVTARIPARSPPWLKTTPLGSPSAGRVDDLRRVEADTPMDLGIPDSAPPQHRSGLREYQSRCADRAARVM